MPPKSSVIPVPAGERKNLGAFAQLGAAWLFLVLVFLPDWLRMVGQWLDSSTYNHVLLVPAILAWLVWTRREALAQLPVVRWAPGLGLVAAAAAVWLAGALGGVDFARQLGAVLALQGAALALLGPWQARALAFPLGYMLFLVPFGDELVPLLQTVTARLSIALTVWSGVPARIDGVFIDTPAGIFEVAEACSGVKFLVAMVAFGALAAYLCFRSWLRRAAFMVLAVVVPVLANGVRAWGTIYVAQFVGAAKAGGFDHIVYGWVFFALVIAAILGASWRYFDRAAGDPLVDVAQIESTTVAPRAILSAPMTVGAIALIILAVQGWASAADRLTARLPAQIFLPEVPEWTRVDYAPKAPWQPSASGADHRLLGRYADRSGRTVDVFYALYAAQHDGEEADAFGQGALPGDHSWDWGGPGPAVPQAKVDWLRGPHNLPRLAETTYRTDRLTTGSGSALRLVNAWDRLLLRARPTAVLILSAEDSPDRSAVEAIAAFRRAIGTTPEWMDRIAGLR